MIVNDLSFNELSELIGPLLSLKDQNDIFSNFSHCYDQEIKSRDDLYGQTRIKLFYKGFSLRFPHIRQSNSEHLSFIIEFKKKQEILDRVFGRASKELVKDLKKICKSIMYDVEFSCHSHTERSENSTIVFHYHKNAFNENWQIGRDISPLLIAPDTHHGNCFVEFLFNAACFCKTNSGFVFLSPEWRPNIYDLSQGIEKDAKEILKEIQNVSE